MVKKNICIFIVICILVLTSLANASVVFAQEGTGSGSQSSSPGTPGQKPLNYLGTFLPDGTKVDNSINIPTNPNFKVEFDKNVVNSLVWTNNSQCFTMKSGNTNIPIKVTKIDDTVDFSQRQYIFVQPSSPLQTGTPYQLIISPSLQAKNAVSTLSGTTNGQDVTVAFKTQGVAPSTTPAAPAPQTPAKTTTPTPSGTTKPSTTPSPSSSTAPNTITGTPPTSATTPTNPNVSSNAQNQNKDAASLTPNNSTNQLTTPAPLSPSADAAKKPSGISPTTWLTVLGAVLLVGWIAIELYIRKKRKK